MNIEWHHVSNTPKVGGSYIVGGYMGSPRHFERAFGTCILLETGPSWSIERDIPIEYWHELLPHPEFERPAGEFLFDVDPKVEPEQHVERLSGRLADDTIGGREG